MANIIKPKRSESTGQTPTLSPGELAVNIADKKVWVADSSGNPVLIVDGNASISETDPVFSASAAFSITTTDVTNWNSAYGWGDHASAGYLTTETDPVFSASTAASITSTDTGNWNTAYGWGDHSAAGYLTTETDPVFSASTAAGITGTDTGNWNAAYGWGDHSTAGYLTTETDPTFTASAAYSITSTDTTNWNTAYGWGDHSVAGYLTTETDPVFTASDAAGITATDISNWNAKPGTVAVTSTGATITVTDNTVGGAVSFNVETPQGIATTDSPTFAGLTAAGLVYPAADGTSGQVIVTDGAGNLSFATVSVSVALDDLTDVTITTVSNNDFLKYNSTSSQWENVAISTDDISEGTTNLYFTDARARAAVSAGTGISYDNTTGVITNSDPDQLVTLTAGTDISITGTYPSFTINYSGSGGSGTVTSVAVSVPTGLAITSGSPVTTSGTIAIGYDTGYSIPLTADQTNWNTAYGWGNHASAGYLTTETDPVFAASTAYSITSTDTGNWGTAYTERHQWDGGSTNLVAATGRTSLGATTVGENFFTLTNPSAITFPRINADNTISALDAATFRTAIGAGTSSTTGTVTSVVAGSYLTGGTITSTGTIAVDATSANTASKVVARDASGNFSAGVITASSINKVAITAPATSATITVADGKTLTASNTLTFTGTDASSVAFGTGGTVLYSGGALGTPSSGTLTNCTFPTLNQNTTGSSGSCTGNSATATKSTNIIGGNNTTLLGSIPYQSNTDTTTLLGPNTTATKNFLSQTGTGTNGAAPSWSTVSKSDVGLSSVENTALSTWAGTANITTLGTVATGSWNASTIGLSKGGTNASITATNGGIIYSTASALAVSSSGTSGQILSSGGAGAPTWVSTVSGLTVTGLKETKTAPSISSGTLTLDCSVGNVFAVSLNANITTLSFTNVPATGTAFGLTLMLTADGTARTITWGSAVKWAGGTAPTLTSTNGKVDVFVLLTHDGTNWYAFTSGQNL